MKTSHHVALAGLVAAGACLAWAEDPKPAPPPAPAPTPAPAAPAAPEAAKPAAAAPAKPAPAPGQRPNRPSLRQIYDQADANKDGKMTYQELKAVRPDFPEAVFKRMDRNNDGAVAKDELPQRPGPGSDRGPQFMRADENKDGKVTFEEFKKLHGNATEADFKKFDKNGDGALTPADRPEGGGARPGGPGRDRSGGRMQAADTDKDGKVTLDEFKKAFPNAPEDAFKRRDANGDGVLSEADRPKAGPAAMKEKAKAEKKAKTAKAAKAAGMFDRADADGDGKVSQAEFSAAVPKMPAERFKTADADHDGMLTRDEARGFAAKKPAKAAAAMMDWSGTRGALIGGADGDKDGKLSFDELSAAKPGFPRTSFDRMDTNKDGVLDAGDDAAKS